MATDEFDIPPAYNGPKIEAVVQLVKGIIQAQATSAEEAFTMAFGVFAHATTEIKPEYREQMLARINEALRKFWVEEDGREREAVM